MSIQDMNLDRVTAKIGPTIKEFFVAKQVGEQFTAFDVCNYCLDHGTKKLAPASADRVMRGMRQRDEVNYDVVERSNSLYEIKERTGAVGPKRRLFSAEQLTAAVRAWLGSHTQPDIEQMCKDIVEG
jgi:hypothetical protein